MIVYDDGVMGINGGIGLPYRIFIVIAVLIKKGLLVSRRITSFFDPAGFRRDVVWKE